MPAELVCVGVCLGLFGCGGSGSGRLPVFGTVRGPGDEKLDGSISFIPAAGQVPASIASLVNGEYRLNSTNGPGRGNYRVLIRRNRAQDPAGPEVEAFTGLTGGDYRHDEWTLAADVPIKSPYQIDFKLE